MMVCMVSIFFRQNVSSVGDNWLNFSYWPITVIVIWQLFCSISLPLMILALATGMTEAKGHFSYSHNVIHLALEWDVVLSQAHAYRVYPWANGISHRSLRLWNCTSEREENVSSKSHRTLDMNSLWLYKLL